MGMKTIKGHFDNLAAAAKTKKSVLEQMTANNAKLAATNKDLGAIVKKLPNKIKNIEQETYRLKKMGGLKASQGNREPTLCPHFKK